MVPILKKLITNTAFQLRKMYKIIFFIKKEVLTLFNSDLHFTIYIHRNNSVCKIYNQYSDLLVNAVLLLKLDRMQCNR